MNHLLSQVWSDCPAYGLPGCLLASIYRLAAKDVEAAKVLDYEPDACCESCELPQANCYLDEIFRSTY